MSAWDTVKSALASFAPMIGASLGGPLGGAAGEFVSKALGVDPSQATPENIAAALSGANADQLLALKNAENDFKIKMAELGFKQVADLEALAVSDRKSARDMQTSVKSTTPTILTYMITAGFFSILAMIMFVQIPKEAHDIINVMFGSLGTAWIACVSFWFGSSNGSQDKDKMLYHSTPGEDNATH